MTVQPVDNATADTFALASAAATAASGLIPSPSPLAVSPVPGARPDGSAVAYVATYTGSTSGDVLLVLHEEVATALTAGAVGVELSDAVRPALEAAASSTGPAVLGPVRTCTLDEIAPEGGRGSVVSLLGDGLALAWVGLVPRDGSQAPAVPRQGGFAGADPLSSLGMHLLRDVEMVLSVEIGRARMTVRDLMQLAPGTVVELDRAAGAPADLLVNGRLIARGEVVVVDEDFGLRITELVQPSGETTA